MIKFLFWFTFLFDLFSQIFISYGIVSDSFRWISSFTIAAAFTLTLFRSKKAHSLEKYFIIIIISLIFYLALSMLNGTNVLMGLWGIFIFIKYPMFFLIIYNQPKILDKFSYRLKNYFAFILIIQIIFQTYQYFILAEQWDNIGGTFASFGTGRLGLLIILISCFAISYWSVYRKKSLGYLIMILTISSIISVLGEIKIYYFVLFLLLFLSVLIDYYVQGKFRVIYMLFIGIITFIIIFSLPLLYNNVYGKTHNYYFSDFLILENVQNYNMLYQRKEDGTFNLGRTFSFLVTIDDISKTPQTLLFGYGIGSKAESKAIGNQGIIVSKSGFGNFTGSSLVVFIAEFGLLGTLSILTLLIILVRKLYYLYLRTKENQLKTITHMLILFTILLPLMLFYQSSWVVSVSMQLYWSFMAFVLAKHKKSLLNNSISVNSK